MSGILVIAEHDGGTFKRTAAELLGKAAELASSLGCDVSAAVLGDAPAASLGACGASTVYQASGDFSNYDTNAVVDALAAIIATAQPTAVLGAASYLGKDAVPRLVARLGTGQASECTELRVEGGAIVGRRPQYAGKAFADIRITRSPAFFTTRPNSFPQPSTTGSDAQVVSVTVDFSAPLLTVIERKKPQTAAVDLTEAERIVSGGRSLKSEENFNAIIRPLAQAVKATAGASRAAVDAGYAHHGDQVGQTGKTVNPQLYIACGISGAIQHLAGMRTSKVIVAINKDPEAPIFEHATYGIVNDLFDVCPKLQQAFEELGA
jgi:electron transfer flavoprotein alpha subunit